MSQQKQEPGSEIVLYQTEDGRTRLEVKLENQAVWLSLNQLAELFQRDKSVISKHIKNVFEEGELQENSVVANFATTAADGKTYQVDHYNLDAIIAVGYRVKSCPEQAAFRQQRQNRSRTDCRTGGRQQAQHGVDYVEGRNGPQGRRNDCQKLFERGGDRDAEPRGHDAGQRQKEWQKDGGKNIKTGDFFAPIFLPAVLLFCLQSAAASVNLAP